MNDSVKKPRELILYGDAMRKWTAKNLKAKEIANDENQESANNYSKTKTLESKNKDPNYQQQLNTRLYSTQNKQIKKQIFEEEMEKYQFKPQISQESANLALQQKEKLKAEIQELQAKEDSQITTISINLFLDYKKMKSDLEKEKLRAENAEKQLTECTFQPNSKYQAYINDIGIKKSKALFDQSSIYHASKHQDRQTLDIEYEKHCDQCTFQPDIYQKQEVSQFIPTKSLLEEKAIEKSVARIQAARQKKILAEEIKKTGNTTNSSKRNAQQEKVQQIDQNNLLETKIYKTQQLQQLNQQTKKESKQKSIKKSSEKKQNQNKEEKQAEVHQEFAFEQQFQSLENQAEQKEEPAVPLLFVDVNIEEGQASRIIVHEGDTAQQLASEFARENNLDEHLQQKLEELLDQQIKNLLTKIDEEEENSENPVQFY